MVKVPSMMGPHGGSYEDLLGNPFDVDNAVPFKQQGGTPYDSMAAPNATKKAGAPVYSKADAFLKDIMVPDVKSGSRDAKPAHSDDALVPDLGGSLKSLEAQYKDNQAASLPSMFEAPLPNIFALDNWDNCFDLSLDCEDLLKTWEDQSIYDNMQYQRKFSQQPVARGHSQHAHMTTSPPSPPSSLSSEPIHKHKMDDDSCKESCSYRSQMSDRENSSVGGNPSSSEEELTEFQKNRKRSLERYREKKRNRKFSKKVRYHLRKMNADRRPRYKGRFIKKGEVIPQEALDAANASK